MHDHHHEHDHGHSHDHAHAASGPDTIEQTFALLKYMLEHNQHHAEELHDLAHQLEDQGRHASAESMHAAIERFGEGNRLLEQALQQLQDGEKA